MWPQSKENQTALLLDRPALRDDANGVPIAKGAQTDHLYVTTW